MVPQDIGFITFWDVLNHIINDYFILSLSQPWACWFHYLNPALGKHLAWHLYAVWRQLLIAADGFSEQIIIQLVPAINFVISAQFL